MRKTFNKKRKLKGTKTSRGKLPSASERIMSTNTDETGRKLKFHPRTANDYLIRQQTDSVLNSYANQFQFYSNRDL
jgi:hypothetical protein